MFTIKIYKDALCIDEDNPSFIAKQKILDAEAFTINYVNGMVEITAHRSGPLSDVRFDIGDPAQIPEDKRSGYGDEFWDRAIIENSAGRTTEHFHPAVHLAPKRRKPQTSNAARYKGG